MTVKVTCNRPKVTDAFVLGRLIRRKWMPGIGLRIEACDSRITIEGDSWPMLYRIPEDVDPSRAYPGMKGMAAPVEIGWLLVEIAPYLVDRLVVTATRDGLKYRWVIMPDSPIIKVFVDPISKKESQNGQEPHSPSDSSDPACSWSRHQPVHIPDARVDDGLPVLDGSRELEPERSDPGNP